MDCGGSVSAAHWTVDLPVVFSLGRDDCEINNEYPSRGGGGAEALWDEHGCGAGPRPDERLRQLLPSDVAVLELPDVVRVREGAVAAGQDERVVVRDAV